MKKSDPTMKGLKMDSKCLNFLCEAFGGGSLDWRHLFNEMEDFELEPSEVIDEAKSFSENYDFNSLMYTCLYLGSEKMKNVLIDYAKDHCDNSNEIIKAIEDYEVGIYINYLDSFFDDDVFSQFSYQELKDENKQKEMLKMLLEKIGVKCDSKDNQE